MPTDYDLIEKSVNDKVNRHKDQGVSYIGWDCAYFHERHCHWITQVSEAVNFTKQINIFIC